MGTVPRFTKIVELRPPMQQVNTEFIVLDKGEPFMVLKEGKELPSCYAIVADNTAAVKFQAIGQDEVDAVEPCEILRLTSGLFMMEKGGVLLRCGRGGWLLRVGSFDMVYTEEPNLSNIPWALDTATNVYNPSVPLTAKPWQPPR
eukprot:jgi/Botrbrau1/21420/Bobra.0216s0035.1